MVHHAHNPAEVQERLWNEVEMHQIGMLGVLGGAHHFQPMTAFVEREANQIWFYSYNDTDLAQAAADGPPAAFIFQTREVQACIDGMLSVDHDEARIERYWNAAVAAWYPQGRHDPRLTLLRLDCTEASVWLSEAGPMRQALELARAAASRRLPDVGEHVTVTFH